MKPILTIHTATYNRAYILEKAYRSLQKQTEMNFEWLITDDGSTDGTEELVDGWIKEQNPFNIRYIKLEHQGLIRAVNYAISVANGKYYFRLDSDDYLRYDIALSIVAGYPSYIFKTNKKWLTVLALPYGILLSFRRREQFKWDDPINKRNYI